MPSKTDRQSKSYKTGYYCGVDASLGGNLCPTDLADNVPRLIFHRPECWSLNPVPNTSTVYATQTCLLVNLDTQKSLFIESHPSNKESPVTSWNHSKKSFPEGLVWSLFQSKDQYFSILVCVEVTVKLCYISPLRLGQHLKTILTGMIMI